MSKLVPKLSELNQYTFQPQLSLLIILTLSHGQKLDSPKTYPKVMTKKDAPAPGTPDITHIAQPPAVYGTKPVTIGNHTTDAFTIATHKIGVQAVGTQPTYVPTSAYKVDTKVWPATGFAQNLSQGDDKKEAAPGTPDITHIAQPPAVYGTKPVTIGNHTTDAFTIATHKIGVQAVGTQPTYVPTSAYPVITKVWPATGFAQNLASATPAKAAEETPVEPAAAAPAPAVGAKNPKAAGAKAPEAPKLPPAQYTNKSVVIGNATTDAFTTQDVKIGTQTVGTQPKYVPTPAFPVGTKTWPATGYAQNF